jgi:hypothetical protein
MVWFAVSIVIEKKLPAIMEDYKKSKNLISVSSGLIGIFVAATIFAVISVFKLKAP